MRTPLSQPADVDPRFLIEDFEPAYLATWRRGELGDRVAAALEELRECRACPRDCAINRLEDETAARFTGRHAVVSSAFPHFGEEDCLRGTRGSGTIFFSLCNLRCATSGYTEPAGKKDEIEEIEMERRFGWTTWLGWLGVALFVAIYAIELLPHHGRPATLRWIGETFGRGGLIALNILIVLAFLALLPYRRPTKGTWKGKGAFIAFVIALMTEMFGWPLLLFLLAPLFEVPNIAHPFFDAVGHWPARAGTAMSFAGLALVAFGWHQIHRAVRDNGNLVTTGLYRFMRHPQYTGLLLFTLGWILHWPSVVTLALWPLLVVAYVWLAKHEEKIARDEFGTEWDAYAERTKRFVPGLF